MADAGSLCPTEARDLRRRRAISQWALGTFFVAAAASMIAVGYEWRFAWMAGCLPGAAVCLILHGWGMRCPRCRHSVFGRNIDETTYHPSDPVIGPGLPNRCRTCGVRLTPAESVGREVGGTGSGGRAE